VPQRGQDIWSQWLLQRRFGGDPECLQAVLDHLTPVRDRVLSNAGLGEGEVLLDVGCGDGLIAFGAMEGYETTRAIFSDISQDLLAMAEQAGFEEVDLELRASVGPMAEGVRWDAFLEAAPNPQAPTRAEAIDESLSADEAQRFFDCLRPLVEGGRGARRSAVAYLRATR